MDFSDNGLGLLNKAWGESLEKQDPIGNRNAGLAADSIFVAARPFG